MEERELPGPDPTPEPDPTPDPTPEPDPTRDAAGGLPGPGLAAA